MAYRIKTFTVNNNKGEWHYKGEWDYIPHKFQSKKDAFKMIKELSKKDIKHNKGKITYYNIAYAL